MCKTAIVRWIPVGAETQNLRGSQRSFSDNDQCRTYRETGDFGVELGADGDTEA